MRRIGAQNDQFLRGFREQPRAPASDGTSSAGAKRRQLPSPEVLALQKSLRITLTFQGAAQLISFKLTEPEDFAAEVIDVAASDLDVLTDRLAKRDPEVCLRLFQQLPVGALSSPRA